MPIRGDSFKPLRSDSFIHPEYFFAIRPSAPHATIIRMDPSTSPAMEDAFSSACSTSFVHLTTMGIVIPYTIPMNTRMELVTKVSDQEYVKATMTAAIMSDVNWMKVPSFSEMPIWSTLAVLVRVFDA
jgi:hypothetical protein